jgi:dsRNA-specific ribonuclease
MMKRQRAAVFFLRYPKRALAATIAVVLLSSCEYRAVDSDLSATENIAVMASLYDTYDCPRIIQAAKGSEATVKHFDELMAKSGNAFTNFVAYGSERSKALATQHAAEQAMKRKSCSSEPDKVGNKPESAPSVKRDRPKS